ncbi:GreA/GreB family elongation factor [Mycobacterium sp. NPDC003449]
MTASQRVWMSPQAHDRLQSELATLRDLIATDAADDSDENQVAIQRARQTRIQHIHDLLMHAVVGENPPDDGVAEPGMVLTVRYELSGDTETFLLGVRGAEYGDLEVYSLDSPLGAALAGARPGERRDYQVPSGGLVPVTLLAAVPFGLHDTAVST